MSFLAIINVIFVRAINSPKLQVVLFLAKKIQRDFCKKSSCNTKLTLKDIVHKGGMRNVAILRQTDFVFFDKPATAIFNSKMFFFHKMWYNGLPWFSCSLVCWMIFKWLLSSILGNPRLDMHLFRGEDLDLSSCFWFHWPLSSPPGLVVFDRKKKTVRFQFWCSLVLKINSLVFMSKSPWNCLYWVTKTFE